MKQTHHHLAMMLSAVLALSIPSCGQQSSRPPAPPVVEVYQDGPMDAASVQRLMNEHAAQLKAEHDQRLSAEQQCLKEQATSKFWQNLTLWLGAGATLLLLVGTALGSSARHETEKP
jgi:hypothetical protein